MGLLPKRCVFRACRRPKAPVEYVRYLQRVNRFAGADALRLLGLESFGLSRFFYAERHEESTVLRVWRLVLSHAGPWNELALAWGYRYRMDPAAGDVLPGPELFDQPCDWAFSVRLYHSLTREQLASRSSLTVERIKYAESHHGYSAPQLQTLHTADLIPEASLRAALHQFHGLAPADHDTVGSWLAALRRNAGMTKDRLAAAIQRSPSLVSSIEHGGFATSESVVRRWCAAWGFRLRWWRRALSASFRPLTPHRPTTVPVPSGLDVGSRRRAATPVSLKSGLLPKQVSRGPWSARSREWRLAKSFRRP